jgi:two-component system sensor histidine kinase ChiS
MRRFLLTLLCIAAISTVVFYIVSVPHGQRNSHAVGGVIDLRDADFGSSVFALAGEWEFYWNRLLEPNDFAAGERGDKSLIALPDSWNGAGYPRTGHATYRLTLLLPEGEFMLYVSEILSAAEVWINGDKIFVAGKVGTSKAEYVPYSKNEIVRLSVKPAPNGDAAPERVFEIVVRAVNYHRINGGIRHAFRIGSEQLLLRWAFSRWIVLCGLASAFFIIGFYHFTLFLFQKDRIYIVFAACCILSAVRFLIEQDSAGSFFLRNTLNIHINAIYWMLFSAHSALILVFSRIVFELRWNRRTNILFTVSLVLPIVLMLFLPEPPARFMPYLYYFPGFTMIVLAGQKLSPERIFDRPYLGLYFVSLVFYFIWGPVANGLTRAFFFAAPVLSNTFVILSQFVMLSQDYASARNRAQALEEENRLLARLSEIKGRFWSNLSHEMKTPLAVISSGAQLARALTKTDEGKTEKIHGALDAVESGVNRLARIAENTIEMSRIRGVEDMGKLDFCRLLKTVCENCGPLPDPESRLVLDIPDSLPPVVGNGDDLRQVIHNLVGNAAEHTYKGNITVRAFHEKDGKSKSNDFILTEVTDTGTGISEELLPRVFEMWVKEETSDGNGLGLYICRAIIEAHGGSIGIESEPGVGTRVFFRLPVSQGYERK